MSLRFQQKLIIPADGRPLIERLQLRTELEQAITTRRVVALAAPAGWGKTTALAQWAAISSLPVAWYTLDPGDRDPKLFLDYLLHSIADFVDGAAELLARLVVSDPQGLPEIFHATALAISAGRIPFALVLDDFHVFDDAPPGGLPGTNLIFDLLASVAQYATKCHIVLVSRTLPALRGLVRMVAQQRAAVFDYTALQFSAAEIQQLAGQAYALTLSDAHAEQLVVRLDGWITGIVLSLDRSGMPGDAPARNTDAGPALPAMPIEMDTSQVYAFFAEQIIAPLPPALQLQARRSQQCRLKWIPARFMRFSPSKLLPHCPLRYSIFWKKRACSKTFRHSAARRSGVGVMLPPSSMKSSATGCLYRAGRAGFRTIVCSASFCGSA